MSVARQGVPIYADAEQMLERELWTLRWEEAAAAKNGGGQGGAGASAAAARRQRKTEIKEAIRALRKEEAQRHAQQRGSGQVKGNAAAEGGMGAQLAFYPMLSVVSRIRLS